jgi:hypothetical protein
MAQPRATRRVRVCYFNTWAQGLEDAAAYVARAPAIELGPLVSDATDKGLVAKARLDCDWYGENTRIFASLNHPDIEFLPSWVCGIAGILEVAQAAWAPGEERWLITMGHQPQALGAAAAKVFELLRRRGVRQLFYAFDEASRFMPCFGAIAPYLDVLVHDEDPLEASGKDSLRPGCLAVHRSWVANVAPFEVPFHEAPEEKILFLGSQLGMTPHREKQISFLKNRFKDKFIAINDHSVGVSDRPALNRFKVSLCPEGRKFTTPAMARSHTDRPFWSGCCGLLPVAEDSKSGGRLEQLHQDGLVIRYPHGDLKALGEACDRALSVGIETRRKVYDHFNRQETIGTVVSGVLHDSR